MEKIDFKLPVFQEAEHHGHKNPARSRLEEPAKSRLKEFKG
jgi:hypothetical protein